MSATQISDLRIRRLATSRHHFCYYCTARAHDSATASLLIAMVGFHGMLVAASLALLVHATLCAIQHREYLKAVQQPFTYSPAEIALQCIGAVLIGTWGVLGLQGSFLPIRTTETLNKQCVSCFDALLFFSRRLSASQ